MLKLVQEIAAFLGEPQPFEIERKFLIEYPDIAWMEAQPNCQRVEVIQTYLKSDGDEEVRVRQRGLNGHYTYYQTTKRRLTAMKRIEVERRLTQEEYLSLLMDADTSKRQIRKTRYCLTWDRQYFEVDVFPFWKDRALLEIELNDEQQEVRLPEAFRLIREVTDDPAYSNYKLADFSGEGDAPDNRTNA